MGFAQVREQQRKEKELQRLAASELELIQKLQQKQVEQRVAYEELETALGLKKAQADMAAQHQMRTSASRSHAGSQSGGMPAAASYPPDDEPDEAEVRPANARVTAQMGTLRMKPPSKGGPFEIFCQSVSGDQSVRLARDNVIIADKLGIGPKPE